MKDRNIALYCGLCYKMEIFMKKILMLLLIPAILAGSVLLAVSCDRNGNKNSDDPNDDSFWLKEEKVFSPTDIERTGTDKEVSDLYQNIKTAKPDNIVLTAGEQVLVLEKRNDNTYAIKTYIVNGSDYIPMFAAGEEIVKGIGYPSEYEVKTVDGNETCIMKGSGNGHAFTLTCTALADMNLLHFSLDVKIGSNFSLTRLDFGLTMEGKASVSYGQMPISIYGNMYGYDSVGIGMPAAYLWDKGREAVILFDYTNMTWMGSGVYLPGRSGYVDAVVRGEDTVLGLCYGMNNRNRPVDAGTLSSGSSMKIEFYLYSGLSAKRTGVDCIAVKTAVMASVHPTMVEYPSVRDDLKDSVTLNWEEFADGTAEALLNPLAYNKVSMNLKDPVLTSEKRGSAVYMSYARQTSERYSHTDYSCNNNWLAALAAYNRLKGNEDVNTLVSAKMDALQFYYDPEANMIRWGFRYNNQVGAVEMPWQNFFYHSDIYRSSMHASTEDFSPAALSNLLSSIEGMTELVENSGYVLSQWIDPIEKKSETQKDVPALNIVYEPWQIGTYAYVCVKGYDISGSQEYLDMAATSLTKVIEEVHYKVENEIYTKEFTDSAEFPITELFGSANGTYAAYRLFELTGEEKYLNYSEAFFGMLSQLTFWYDDNMSDAAKNSTLLGLFEPHGGASHACPWESIEAILPLTEILDATGEYAFNDLILAIINCQRVSSYSFYPVTWSEDFKNQWAYNQEDFYYIPTEPLYNTIGNGNGDYGALYMSSLSLWNYLLYEAFGTVDNADVMALCTDIHTNYESAVRGAERSFILYNPTNETVTVTFTQHELPDGSYIMTVEGQEGKEYTAAELTDGIRFTLESRSSLRLEVVSASTAVLVEANQEVMTRYRLAMAYHTVTEKVQSIARESFAEIFPDADEDELDTLANYVCTYMTYEEAMAHALNSKTAADAKQSFCERAIANAKVKKLYDENAEVQLPSEYVTLLEAVDQACNLYRGGSFKEAYLLCDSLVDAIENNTEKELAETLISDAGA